MNAYQNFLAVNYKAHEKINIMTFPEGRVKNIICQVDKLQKVSGECQVDTYMSMNPLVAKDKHINRDKEHVGRLKWLYVDLDYYHSEYKDFTKKQILGLLELDYFVKKIPEPTYVVDSGRGIYLLWRIDEHINAYPRWVRMQKYLCDQLNEFGADKKVASDSARVLRQIGSINSKSGTKVDILQYKDSKFSLTNLMREYVIDEAPSSKMINYAKKIAEILEIDVPELSNRAAVSKFIRDNKEPANLFYQMKKVKKTTRKAKSKIAYIGTEYSLLYSRIQDIEKLLLQFRDCQGGYREYILFLYRYWQLCITDDKEISLVNTLQLNSRLSFPLDEREVIFATRSAEKYYDAGKIFRCSNAHVIDALHITPEEMKELSIFISPEERKRRKKIRNKNAYLACLKKCGKLTASEKIRQRRIKVYKLIQKGLCTQEICSKLNISRATFYVDKQQIERYLATKQEKSEFMKKRFQEYRQKMEEKCLNFSAFVLHKSFRTCPVPLLNSVYFSAEVISQRSLRAWGRSLLRSVYVSSRYKPLTLSECQGY